jgi:predicted N-acetyltransferase YhbS
MALKLRQESSEDFEKVFRIIESAFKNEAYSDNKEQFLVKKLRSSDAFIPELSIVAEDDGKIVGHILLTKIKIKNDQRAFESLALAPVSVMPIYQKKGIGGQLIKEAHKIAKVLGYKSIVLLGHETYYPKFGYELARNYDIKIPFDAADENCMVIELVKDGLKGVNGVVEYAEEFFE